MAVLSENLNHELVLVQVEVVVSRTLYEVYELSVSWTVGSLLLYLGWLGAGTEETFMV
jgi:hypothetical protein